MDQLSEFESYLLIMSTYASSVPFGHPKHCFFDNLDTQKFRSGFADDDNSRRWCM